MYVDGDQFIFSHWFNFAAFMLSFGCATLSRIFFCDILLDQFHKDHSRMLQCRRKPALLMIMYIFIVIVVLMLVHSLLFVAVKIAAENSVVVGGPRNNPDCFLCASCFRRRKDENFSWPAFSVCPLSLLCVCPVSVLSLSLRVLCLCVTLVSMCPLSQCVPCLSVCTCSLFVRRLEALCALYVLKDLAFHEVLRHLGEVLKMSDGM